MQLRGGSRATATSNIECFVTIVNDFQPLTIVTKGSILNDAAALDPSLQLENFERTSKILLIHSQLVFTCSKLTIETLEQGVKYVQLTINSVSVVNFEHVIAGWVMFLTKVISMLE